MPLENLLVEIAAGIATVTVNRPAALNALTLATLAELEGVVEEIARNPEIRAVILTGAGTKAFVAGADIAVMREMAPPQACELDMPANRINTAIERSPKPF